MLLFKGCSLACNRHMSKDSTLHLTLLNHQLTCRIKIWVLHNLSEEVQLIMVCICHLASCYHFQCYSKEPGPDSSYQQAACP